MRVAYFWYRQWSAAMAVLPDGWRPVYTGPGDAGYFRAFTGEWDTGEALLAIEQDVLIHGTVVSQLEECPEPWCEFPWWVTPRTQLSTEWLGCTRFSAELQAAVPAGDLCRPNSRELCEACAGTIPCFRHLDVFFDVFREATGMPGPHQHLPVVRHLRA